jgi:hypothetical protein
MAGTPKDLEVLWRHNSWMRKQALSGKLSPQELQSLPPHLRTPVKVRGLARPKGLRGPVLVNYLISLGIFWQDKRFDDCVNALLQHGIVKPSTFECTEKPWPAVVRHNEHYLAKCLAEVRAREERYRSVRQACREVAAEWGWPGHSLTAAAQQLRVLYRTSKK